MRLVFATQNTGKLLEAKAILPKDYTVVSLDEFPGAELPEETETTLEGNALLKARYVNKRFKMPCFADDTGLFIPYLNGQPGVKTARFAGPQASDKDNMQKALDLLKGVKNRDAYFKTVIALMISGKEFLFESTLHGKLSEEILGDGGFGYDPIFVPLGFSQTLATMDRTLKNSISHRKQALVQMANFLK